MRLQTLLCSAAAILLTCPAFAATYFGGYEDTTVRSDYDYNDIVFSLSGPNLTLRSLDGTWYGSPVVNQDANPFWDNTSADGPKMNIGNCIYGGGNCGAGLSPNALFLASSSSPKLPADTVYFTNSGSVSANIILKISSINNVLGWYSLDGKSGGYLNPTGSTGTFQFAPGNEFALFGTTYLGNKNNANQYTDFISSVNQDSRTASPFAFFAAPASNTAATPEPGTLGVMACGLIALGSVARRRYRPGTR